MPPIAEMTESSREGDERDATIQRDVGGGENDRAARASRAARTRRVAVLAVGLDVSANDDAGGVEPDASASVLSRSRTQKKRLLSEGEGGTPHALVEGVSDDFTLVARVRVVVFRVTSARSSVTGTIDVIALARSACVSERGRVDDALLAQQDALGSDASGLRLNIDHTTQRYGDTRVVVHQKGSQKRKRNGAVLLRAEDGPASLVVTQKMDRSVSCKNVCRVCLHLPFIPNHVSTS